jgi:molybdopterin adenylyltransferase
MGDHGCHSFGKGAGMKDLVFAVLTISDRSSRGEREDTSGPALVEYINRKGGKVKYTNIIADEKDWIKRELIMHSDDEEIQVILTTGGTGLSPRDVTPEATVEIADYIIPGICEYIRKCSLEITLHGMLSRAVCVVRNHCLIINLPGSPKGAVENLQFIESVLPHAIAQLRNLPVSQDHKLPDL